VYDNQQTSFFATGFHNYGYSFVDQSPDINYPSGTGNDNPHDISNSELFFDLDDDSINDIVFNTSTSYGNGGGLAYLSLECLNGYQTLIDASGKYAGIVNEFEIINTKQNWSNKKTQLRHVSYHDCVTLINDPLWADGETKFLAFRKPSDYDTTYAWIKFNVYEIGRIISYRIFEKSYYSTINSIDVEKSIVSIYPNPVCDKICIFCDNLVSGDYTLFSSNGVVIESNVIVNEETVLELESISPGFYFLNLQINGFRYYKKVVKI
jgi:hypothetical protein